MNRLNASENTMRCILHYGSCITCANEKCPFVTCQHEECLACENRASCPMCIGDCNKCKEQTICKIIRLDWRLE